MRASGISQESPPESFDNEQRDFLTQRFIDVGAAFAQFNKFVPRKRMPYKPQIGNLYYFNNPTDSGYDSVINKEGLWLYKSIGYVFVA